MNKPKNNFITFTASFVVIMLVLSCQSKKSGAVNIKAAPAGNFLSGDSVAQRPDTVHSGSQSNPVLIILKNNKAVTGKLNFHGSLAVRSAADIQMDSAGESIRISLSLPKDMRLASTTQSKAILVSEMLESPEAGSKFLHISSENKLILGYIWQTSLTPLSFTSSDKFLLHQIPLQVLPKGPDMINVAVEILTDSGFIPVPQGTLITFKKSGTVYQVFLLVSVYQNAPASGDGPTGYVLNVVITKI